MPPPSAALRDLSDFPINNNTFNDVGVPEPAPAPEDAEPLADDVPAFEGNVQNVCPQ